MDGYGQTKRPVSSYYSDRRTDGHENPGDNNFDNNNFCSKNTHRSHSAKKKTTTFEISGASYHTTTISLIIITHYLGVQDSSLFTRITPYKQNLKLFSCQMSRATPFLDFGRKMHCRMSETTSYWWLMK